MLRSLMTAVTGVRAHQTMLDVTGNNIANANTTGFKKDITVFQDLLYQTQKAATAPGNGRGGINAAQVGLGVQVGAIETIFTQGGANYTGNATDMMIQGSGFFVYDDGSGSRYYSRAGSITRDGENNLVQSGTGYYVQGYAMEKDPLNPRNYVKAANLSTVSIPLGKKLEPNATSVIDFQCNLNSETEAYLPYGFLDLPYNAGTKIGWPDNPQGTAKITLPPTQSGTEYDVSFETTGVTKAIDATTHDGTAEKYLTMSIQIDNKTPVEVTFAMTGIDSTTGKPILEVVNPPAGQVTPTGGSAIGSTDSHIITLLRADNSVNAYYDVVYNAKTGTLQFQNVTPATATYAGGKNAVDFTYNMTSSMNYTNFSLPNTLTGAVDTTTGAKMDYDVLVEFNERNLSNGSTTATLWFSHKETTTKTTAGITTTNNKTEIITEDTTTTPSKFTATFIEKATVEVFFDAAGNFDHVGEIKDLPEPLRATATTTAKFRINPSGGTLSFRAGVDENSMTTVGTTNQGGFHQTKTTIYDCNGKAYTLEVNYKKVTEDRWRWEAFILDSEGKAISTGCDDSSGTTTNPSFLIPRPNSGEIYFCGCGPIGSPLEAELSIPFSLIGEPNQTIKLNFGGNGDKLYGVTQYASETTTKAVYQDGYGMGVLSDFSIGTDGTVVGSYTNGQRIPMYRVALATFANEQGLSKVGETMFQETVNSGQANIDAAAVGTKGSILAQNVEMSNVDLTEEFTHLIVAQRGFQANTRVITTSDQILEEVVNLKR